MDDTEFDDQVDDEYLEDSSYQACYVYRSATRHDATSHHPNKRRKRSHESDTHRASNVWLPNDTHGLAKTRRQLHEGFLSRQQDEQYQDHVVKERASELSAFIKTADISISRKRLPIALILTGLDQADCDPVLEATAAQISQDRSCIYVNLQPRQCPNLQNALKNLIRTAITERAGLTGYNTFLSEKKKLYPLNFDLELLNLFLIENEITKIVVSLPDVEDVDASTSNDLINTLQQWQSQISSVLLLGITSTRELFEQRLSKSCLKLLDAYTFNYTPSANQNSAILRTIQTEHSPVNNGSQIFLGPSAMKTLHDLSQVQGNNAQLLKASLQYIAFSHFTANPASALAETNIVTKDDTKILADIAHSTASFRGFCKTILEERTKEAGSRVRQLLDDDEVVLCDIRKEVEQGMKAFSNTSDVIYHFSDLYEEVSAHARKLQRPRLEVELQLYQTMQDLANCQAFDDLRNAIVSLEPREVAQILKSCEAPVIDNLGLRGATDALLVLADTAMVLDSNTHDTSKGQMTPNSKRAKSMKVARSPAKAARVGSGTVKPEVERLIEDLIRTLGAFSLDMDSLLLHEAYLLSSKNIPFKQNFDPQPRVIIERALLRPGDYLTCDCCSKCPHVDANLDGQDEFGSSAHNTSKKMMPPACVLFTLLQEAPTIVNVRDLFDAFSSQVVEPSVGNGAAQSGGSDGQSTRTMALFYRSLAELKMLGLIKASAGTQVKRRTAGGKASKAATQDIDFIAKTSWAGS